MSIAAQMGRRYARLVGRGTTALYVALRALAERDGAGTLIMPDVICSAVLDGVLLAGFTPVFADVLPRRFTLDPASVQRHLTTQTRGVLSAHLFGHVCDMMPTDFGVPLIEDAIQGLGGAVGTRGDLTIIGFDRMKMIGGRGGVVLTDDPTLWDIIQRVPISPDSVPLPPLDQGERFRAYRGQLAGMTESLLLPFVGSVDNLGAIERGWSCLAQNVRDRNEKAAWLRDSLADLPLALPEIRAGDAFWRFTFAAPSITSANWIRRQLQGAGLPGSGLYPPLSTIFAPDSALFSTSLDHRLVNLWIDESTSRDDLARSAAIVRASFERKDGHGKPSSLQNPPSP